jgi:PAS domain S-box-containing protein
VAVAVLIRRERAGRDRETLLDVLIVTASLGALSWVFLMAPYAQAAELSGALKLLSVAYPALDLVLVVLTLRLAVSGTRTTPAKALLLLWAGCQLAGDTLYGVLVLAGRWSLDSHVQLLWIAAFAFLGAAALHPSMASLGAPEPAADRREQTSAQSRKAVVVGAVLVLPVVLMGKLLTGDLDDLPVIAAASALVFVLALARGSATARTDDEGGRAALVRLVAGFVVCALVPLGLLAEASIRLSERAVEGDARASIRATSTVSAELVEQQLTGLGQLVESYAERQLLVTALGDGEIGTFDRAGLGRHLAQLQALSPGVAGVFVTDAEGRLSNVLPPTAAIVDEDFSFRDWYRGALATDGHYVSEAYRTAIAGEARVVAVATAIRRPGSGELLGILAVAYDLRAVQEFADGLSAAQGVRLRITDQRGTVVASPGSRVTELVSASGESGVADALVGREGMATGESGGEEVLSAYAPVPGLGWTVTAQVPTEQAYASVATLRSTVLGIAVLLAQALLGGLALMARAQRQRREAERRLVEREEATRGILDAAADAFVAFDGAGVVTSWSTQSELLFGWTAEQACGRPLAEIVAPADRREDPAEQAGTPGGQTVMGQRVEADAVHRDGRRFPVEMVVWQSVAGGTVSYHSFIHDISDRKGHEAALAAARDEALEGSRMKTEFLAVMSHELRTPLNGVMGMTSLLLSTPLSSQQRDYAETVRTSADALLGLLNDVLDLSKVEADRLELEALDFNLHPVVRDIVHLVVVSARDKSLALEADIDPDVPLALSGDPARLRQVLLNLVGNAVKFTAEGSVHLRVRTVDCAGRDGIWLRFEVTDTGIGIPAEARDRLFLAFSQVDASTTRRYGGTGLGLAISKSLVTLFGGEIGVDSEPGAGSTFWFTARFDAGTPSEGSSPGPAPAYVPRPRSGRRGLVLVVDDNATNQKIAVQMLQTLGHRADVAANGVEAVEAFRTVPYDLVLMDCRMPLMDGYQATLSIRSSEAAGRRTPILAMTASAMDADRQRCLEVGMDDYLSKPVRLAEVADKLDRWFADGTVEGPQHPVSATVSLAHDAAAVARQAALVAAAALGVVQDAAHVAQDAAVLADEQVAIEGVTGASDRPALVVAAPTASGPVLDDEIVAGLRDLGADFLARLVPVFVLAAPDRLADVRAAVEAGDAPALADAAHALRGSAANLGGARVAAVCARIETAARAGDLDAAPADLAELDAELAAMLVSVEELVPASG